MERKLWKDIGDEEISLRFTTNSTILFSMPDEDAVSEMQYAKGVLDVLLHPVAFCSMQASLYANHHASLAVLTHNHPCSIR